MGFPDGVSGSESTYNAGNMDLITRSGRFLGVGNGKPLQYFCLENPIDRRAWRATVHGIAKSRQGLATKSPLHPK